MNDHYKQSSMEAIDFIDTVLAYLNDLTPNQHYYVGCALKYAMRAGYKTPSYTEDARKCADYLHRFATYEWSKSNE